MSTERERFFNRFTLIWFVTVCLVIFGARSVWSMLHRHEPERLKNNFPPHTIDHAGLPPNQDSVEFRIETYKPAADSAKLKPSPFQQFFPDSGVLVERGDYMFNGNLRITTFRPDRTVIEVREYYPPQGEVHYSTPPSADIQERKVLHHALFGRDGKTFLSDTLLRADGTVLLAGARLADSSFDVTYRREDGVSISEHDRYNRKGLLIEQQLFNADGSASLVRERQSDNTIVSTQYDEKGTKVYESVEDALGWTLTTSYFRTDGETVRLKVVQNSYGTVLEYYRPNGKLEEKRFFRFYGWMLADVFDEDGMIIYKQEWRITNVDDSTKARQYQLDKLVDLGIGEKELRTVRFFPDGVTPTTVLVEDTASVTHLAFTEKVFREDGTLSLERVFNENGDVARVSRFTAGAKIRERISRSRIKLHALEEPKLKPLQSRAKPQYPAGNRY